MLRSPSTCEARIREKWSSQVAAARRFFFNLFWVTKNQFWGKDSYGKGCE